MASEGKKNGKEGRYLAMSMKVEEKGATPDLFEAGNWLSSFRTAFVKKDSRVAPRRGRSRSWSLVRARPKSHKDSS